MSLKLFKTRYSPSLSFPVSQCALNTRIPFGLYFSNNEGPKSARKRASGPLGPCESPMGLPRKRSESSGICSIGEPCPKKNAGIFSGVDGSASRAAFHSASVFGIEVVFDMLVVLVLLRFADKNESERGRKPVKRGSVYASGTTTIASRNNLRALRAARM